MRVLRSVTIKEASSRRSLMSLCYKTISSCCSCVYVEILSTWEVWRALKKLKLHSAASRATLMPLSCSPNFPRARYLDIRTMTHELIVKYLAIASEECFVCWLVLPFRERNNFIQLSKNISIIFKDFQRMKLDCFSNFSLKRYLLYLQIFNARNYILFKISASGLFSRFGKFQPRYCCKIYSRN